jgi:protein tyrosine/serine phosphatase
MFLPLFWRRYFLPFLLALPALADSSPEGIKNFYQVDPHVYRGAQPSDEGFQYLAKLGVKTVIDLREADQRSKAEEAVVMAAGMKYVNIPMKGLAAPTDVEISKILGILEGDGGAVFVHCKRGADRTGVVIASYRIERDGWNNADALSEAKTRGMAPFQFPRMSYIRSFRPRTLEAKTSAPGTVATAASDAAIDSTTIGPPAIASSTAALR